MLSGKDHIIRSLNLEVDFQEQVNAFEIKNTLAQVCKDKLLPALDNLFNQMHNNGKIVKADSIVIDLGVINQEQWDQALVDALILKLTSFFQNGTMIRSISVAGESPDTGGTNKIYETTADENICQSIDYFLKTGLLPWCTIIKSRRDFLQHVSRLIQAPHNHYKKILIAVRDENILRRFISQTTTEIQETVLVLTGVPFADIRTLLVWWTSVFKQSDLNVSAEKAVYTSALRIGCEDFPTGSFSVLVSKDIIQRLVPIQQQKLFKLIPSDSRVHASGRKREKIPGFILRAIINAAKETGKQDRQSTEANRGHYIFTGLTAQKTLAPSHGEMSGAEGTFRTVTMKTIAGEGIYINNAGLVVLNPFLMNLFKNVGYIEEKKWISENHQQRAIVLMQYMVTGKQEFPEFDLLLNKIFAGFPLESSWLSDIVLSEFEINESREVLQSVIHHWKALKNTSIEALQATFLQREGKLSYSDNRWFLQVEQNTVDILIGKLPWGISIIRLPWMESRLHVEWT